MTSGTPCGRLLTSTWLLLASVLGFLVSSPAVQASPTRELCSSSSRTRLLSSLEAQLICYLSKYSRHGNFRPQTSSAPATPAPRTRTGAEFQSLAAERFARSRSFAGGVNLYGYVGNNPINFRDPSGLDPGQLFRTLADAGEDAIRYYNPQSIRTGRNGTEFGGVIYRTRNGRFFSYTRAVPAGTKASTDVGTCPRGTTEVADYHTHGKHIPGYEDEEFSDSDKQGNDDFNGGAGEFGFLGTPSGRILMYTPVPGNPLGGTTDVIGYGAHLPYRKRR